MQEQGPRPNVYYLGSEGAAINPEVALEELPNMTMWSTLLKPHHADEGTIDMARSLRASRSPRTLNPLKPYQPSRPDEPAGARVVYDTPKNSAPWGWKVSAYLA